MFVVAANLLVVLVSACIAHCVVDNDDDGGIVVLVLCCMFRHCFVHVDLFDVALAGGGEGVVLL